MADDLQLPKKQSFVGSVISGITGTVKGALTGGLLGAVGGAVVGAAIAAVGMIAAPLTGGASVIATAIGLAALDGAIVGGAAVGTIGAVAGTVTGVVKSREAAQPSAEDITNVAKIAFAQGVAVGHNIEHGAAQQQTKHRDAVTAERAAMAMAERQVMN